MPITESRFRVLFRDPPRGYYDIHKAPNQHELQRMNTNSSCRSYFTVLHSTKDTVIQEIYKNDDVDALMLHSVSNPPPALENFDMYSAVSILDVICPANFTWIMELIHRLKRISKSEISVRFWYDYFIQDYTKYGSYNLEKESQFKCKMMTELRIKFKPEEYNLLTPEDKMIVDINIMRILQSAPNCFPFIQRAYLEIPSINDKVVETFKNFFHIFDGVKQGGEESQDYHNKTMKFRSNTKEKPARRNSNPNIEQNLDKNSKINPNPIVQTESTPVAPRVIEIELSDISDAEENLPILEKSNIGIDSVVELELEQHIPGLSPVHVSPVNTFPLPLFRSLRAESASSASSIENWVNAQIDSLPLERVPTIDLRSPPPQPCPPPPPIVSDPRLRLKRSREIPLELQPDLFLQPKQQKLNLNAQNQSQIPNKTAFNWISVDYIKSLKTSNNLHDESRDSSDSDDTVLMDYQHTNIQPNLGSKFSSFTIPKKR